MLWPDCELFAVKKPVMQGQVCLHTPGRRRREGLCQARMTGAGKPEVCAVLKGGPWPQVAFELLTFS